MADSDRPYTTGEVAEFCDVTINAVKKWIAAGKLPAYRTPGGHFRIER
ncbi:MAG: helix-turn-helix domain-containing protein, partial [Thermodesulfobacteriota bacterium]